MLTGLTSFAFIHHSQHDRFRVSLQPCPRASSADYNSKQLHFITCSCYHRIPFLRRARRRDLFLKVLEQARRRYLKQCLEVGLVRGKELSVDGSFFEVNAAKKPHSTRAVGGKQPRSITR
jgi:hypothetical protein